MPADVRGTETTPLSPDAQMEDIGPYAQPPSTVRELERQGYVTTVSSIPTIQPGTDVQHAGPTMPIPGQTISPTIAPIDMALTKEEKVGIMGSSKGSAWMTIWNKREYEKQRLKGGDT